jgi:hypothetical protein
MPQGNAGSSTRSFVSHSGVSCHVWTLTKLLSLACKAGKNLTNFTIFDNDQNENIDEEEQDEAGQPGNIYFIKSYLQKRIHQKEQKLKERFWMSSP